MDCAEGSEMMPELRNCVNVRLTVSIVSPRKSAMSARFIFSSITETPPRRMPILSDRTIRNDATFSVADLRASIMK
jgi:hypothetical protein